MALEEGIGLSEQAARDLQRMFREHQQMYRTGGKPAPPPHALPPVTSHHSWLEVTATTLNPTADAYPAVVLAYNVGTDIFTFGAACWLRFAHGLTPELERPYLARLQGPLPADGLSVYLADDQGGGGGGTVPDCDDTTAGKVNLANQTLGDGEKTFRDAVHLRQAGSDPGAHANRTTFTAWNVAPALVEGTPSEGSTGSILTAVNYATTESARIYFGGWLVYDGSPLPAGTTTLQLFEVSGTNATYGLNRSGTKHRGATGSNADGWQVVGGIVTAVGTGGGGGGGFTVSDTPTVDLTFTGSVLTAAVIPGGINVTALAGYPGGTSTFLRADGTFAAPPGGGGTGTVTSVDVSGGTTGLTFSGGPVTGAGTITMSGVLAVANGGTGATSTSGALTAIGAQPLDPQLTSLAGLDWTGNAGKVIAVNPGATGFELVTTGGGGFITAVGNTATVTLAVATGTLTANVNDNSIDNLKLRNSAGLSVIGSSVLAGGDPEDIVAGTDTQILRRNGNLLGFGAINLSSANAVGGTLAVARGGTGQIGAATGDLLYGSATNTLARLAAGTAGQKLEMAGGLPAWRGAHGVNLLLSTPQAIAYPNYTAVRFNSAPDGDPDVYWSAGTPNKVTIPAGLGGAYVVTGSMQWELNQDGMRFLLAYRNGAPIGAQHSMDTYNSDARGISSFAAVIVVAAGDVLELIVGQTSLTAGADLNLDIARFSVWKL